MYLILQLLPYAADVGGCCKHINWMGQLSKLAQRLQLPDTYASATTAAPHAAVFDTFVEEIYYCCNYRLTHAVTLTAGAGPDNCHSRGCDS
jgi:hypothetical protein